MRSLPLLVTQSHPSTHTLFEIYFYTSNQLFFLSLSFSFVFTEIARSHGSRCLLHGCTADNSFRVYFKILCLFSSSFFSYDDDSLLDVSINADTIDVFVHARTFTGLRWQREWIRETLIRTDWSRQSSSENLWEKYARHTGKSENAIRIISSCCSYINISHWRTHNRRHTDTSERRCIIVYFFLETHANANETWISSF